MPYASRHTIVLAALLAGCAAGAEPTGDSTAVRPAAPAAPSDTANPVAPDPAPAPVAHADSILRPKPPLVAPPEPMRGLYVNRWQALGRTSMGQLLDVARRTEINALVIDVKDDRGYMLYRSRVPLAREIGADADSIGLMSHARLRALLDTMRVHGIYPIARIVVVKDPLLAERRREWAIRRRDDPAQPWLDKNGRPWLDPNHPGVWKYAADIAAEAVDLGFSEIQLDYVRFPDEDRIVREAVFPLQGGRERAQVIRDQLEAMRRGLAHLGVPFTIDVFGLTTSDTTDMGIGQRWEMFVDRADVVLPMTYPSHYAPGSYGIRSPNAQPYAIIDRALEDAKRRSEGIEGAARIVPWYQDFTLGPPRYGAEQVRAQIQAGYDNGIESWILWNPRSAYTIGALRPAGAAAAPRDSSGEGRTGADSAAATSRRGASARR
ncbi:MAG TPA: putative glycoside hydrolase [Gemmatimonadaceae bacterium]